MLRTHHCNELREAHVGATVTLAGWVDTIRDHGGVIFMDLRDQHGVTQAVFHNAELVRDVGREFVVAVKGEVVPRDAETVNPALATGTVELKADSAEILGTVERPIPFEIRDSVNTREDTRLKYRFLDLRNPVVKDRMLLRSNIIRHLRDAMEKLNFTEIQTPILTASSPEGARDYLVPSRKHRGLFYALPQAPQQFKQLLMASGFDRYFQIAPCFRDEDARADRSPGEFYQLDFEMAFAEQEDVLKVAETVLFDVFRAFTDKAVTRPPFERIPYNRAMLEFGSDKPDLRNPLRIVDLSAFFADADFAPFRKSPTRGIKAQKCADQPRSFFEGMLNFATSIGMKGLGYISVSAENELKGPIVKFLSAEKQSEFRARFELKPLDTVFFISDLPKLVNRYAGLVRGELGRRLNLLSDDFRFCFVVDYPMFGINEESGAVEFTHNPFSMPQGGMAALAGDPLAVLAYQYDVVCNGIELSSGAVRNHRPDIMVKAFEIAGYTRQDVENRFGALYSAFHYGAPPHAGMAPGVDRIVMLLAGTENIREVVPFPMNSAAQDVLLGAPGAVTEQQLREAHVRLR
ncbi:aspartate--tRNA(Asp/Asn) ligase [Clostridia bacterium]|nr:aspartate--tRNA(Asp/Asn) ligase [Clostridia bacterium]